MGLFFKDFDFSIEMMKMRRKYSNQLMEYGLKGEEKVYYQIKSSRNEFLCGYNIRIKQENKKIQFDFIIVSKKCILIIEVKNLLGNLHIDDKGNFIRSIYKKDKIDISGMDNPIIQLEDHIYYFKKFLMENNIDKEVIGYLVMANDKMVITNNYGYKNIIKHDELPKIIEKELMNEQITIEEHKIADLILENDKQYNYYMLSIIKDNIKNQYIPKFINPIDRELYVKLLELRKSIAYKYNIPFCNVFNNIEAERLIEIKPINKEQFLTVKGFKEKKYEMFGEEIIKIFKKFLECGIIY